MIKKIFQNQDIAYNVKALIGIRLILVSVIFGLGGLIFGVEKTPFYALIGASYLVSIFFILLFKWTHISPAKQICFQLHLDLFGILGVLHFSGGIDSIFISLVLLPLIGAGIFLPWIWCLGVCLFTTVIYAAMILVEFYASISFLHVSSLLNSELPEVIYILSLRLLMFWVVSFLSATLSRQLHLQTNEFFQLKKFHDIILDQIGSGILTVNTKNEIIFVNKGAQKMIGENQEELIGTNWKSLFFFTNSNFPTTPWDEISQDIRGYEVLLRKKNGKKVPIGFNVTRLTDTNNQYCGKVMVFRDLTRIKELERKKSQAERLAAIGEMAAGIAHEIRNPLTAISGSVEVIVRKKGFNEKYSELVDVIMREAQRLNQIIENFLTFTRRPFLEKRFVNIEMILDEVIMLLKNSGKIRGDIEVKKENDLGDDALFMFDPNQIKQVFYNLVSNACEAMPEGGEVKISLKSLNLMPKQIQVEISDQGSGISNEKLTQIFTPFFTTKQSGTGLGLAIVHRIIQDHGGSIEVNSDIATGTTFRFVLPKEEEIKKVA